MREDLTSRGVPRSQLQPQAWPAGRQPKPQRARGRRSPAQRAGRLPGRVPAGQAPGSRAETPRCGLRGAGGGCRARRPESGRALGPLRPPPRPPPRRAAGDSGGAGAKRPLILGKTSAGQVGVGRGGERRGRSIGARSSASHLPRRLLASQQMAGAGEGGGAGAAGGSHALPHP